MKIIGLTGGIASGKSTIANCLKKLGAPIFDADLEAKNAILPGSPCFQKVLAVFGKEILNQNGDVDRNILAEIVFNNATKLKELESIIHGYVWDKAESFIAEQQNKKAKAVVLDVPLLLECGWQHKVDLVWLVSVSESEQIKRAMARSGMTEQEVRARMAKQMSLQEKSKYADFIIDNSGSLVTTEAKVVTAWQALA